MIKDLKLFFWFFLGFVLAGYATWSSAETIAALNGYKAEVYGEGIAYRAETAAAACLMASASSHTTVQTACGGKACVAPWSQVAGTCVGTHAPDAQYPGNTSPFASYSTAKYCPSGQNWTFVSPSSCTRPDCVAPDVRDPETGVCGPPPCQQGTPSQVTVWNGCFDMDGISNGCDSGSLSIPFGTLCNGQCWQTIPTLVGCTQPVSGGGPITCTWGGTLTGQPCTSGDVSPMPSPSQVCPDGYSIGTVNGKQGCYKTGSSDPVQSTTTQSTDPVTQIVTTTTTTINTTTNTTTTTTTVYNPANGTTTTNTQNSPTDPNKPMLDPNAKAPGENQDPFEIDETGTPTDGSLSQAKSEFETAANAHKTFIDGLANQGNHGITWDWSFELPSGSCSAYTFTIAGKSFTLDPCEKLGMIRDVLGFFIYITTALALLSIATGYGKEGK